MQFGSNCDNCKKELKKFEPQYFCYFCNLYYCKQCGDLVDDSKIGSYKYVHPHAMAWINLKSEVGLKNIDQYRFGRKIIFTETFGMSGGNKYIVYCNSCKKNVSGIRYICLNCKPGPIKKTGFFDLCANCVKILDEKNNNNMEYNTFNATTEEYGHIQEEHVLLRVAGWNGNYYRF